MVRNVRLPVTFLVQTIITRLTKTVLAPGAITGCYHLAFDTIELLVLLGIYQVTRIFLGVHALSYFGFRALVFHNLQAPLYLLRIDFFF